MNNILEKFKDCNMFSLALTKPIVNMPEQDRESLIKNSISNEKKEMLDRYNYITETEKELPEFEILFNEIFNECKVFYANLRDKNLVKDFSSDFSPFICDHVGKYTKYSEPIKLFWHFYNNMQMIFINNEELETMPVVKEFIII